MPTIRCAACLARSTIDLLLILKSIADRGALFVSLSERWADTTTAAGRLMLTILGGQAEFERKLIREPELPRAGSAPRTVVLEWAESTS